MLSEAQYLEKKQKVSIVVKEFLINKKSIKQISEEVGISTSSVQRYLNDEVYIKDAFGVNASLIIEEIHRMLEENKIEGNKLGGQNFAKNNEATKKENGQFTGSKKK